MQVPPVTHRIAHKFILSGLEAVVVGGISLCEDDFSVGCVVFE